MFTVAASSASLNSSSTIRPLHWAWRAITSSVSSTSSHVPKSSFTGFIPIKALTVTYSLSSGPGGQNVNRTATKVDVRFHLDTATWLSEEVRARLKEKLQNIITKEGYVIVKSERTRSQTENEADAVQKLREAIWSALDAPAPVVTEEEREAKKLAAENAARKRVDNKRRHSQAKRLKRNLDWQ